MNASGGPQEHPGAGEGADASESASAAAGPASPRNVQDLGELSRLVNSLSACSNIGEALVAVRRSGAVFTGVPSDTSETFFSLQKVQDHGAMARVSGEPRDTVAGPEFNVLKWSSPCWPESGLGGMGGSEAMETLAMKAEYSKFKTLEEELSSLSLIEDVRGTLVVTAANELSVNTMAILTGLLFGKKVDCSSSFITWIFKAQITESSVQFSPSVSRALLLRASLATRTRYYSPDTPIGSDVPWLIRRFHYELRRRFDYRRSTSDYERDPMAVCEAVSDALCSLHMDNSEWVEPLLAVLYVRRGDCAMQGTTVMGKRSMPCVLCLYGTSIPRRVQHPMIYSNRLIEKGANVEDDLKTIDGKEVKPDFCDRWSFKLLSLLFSGNWNAMECAIYASKVPVIAGESLRKILRQMLAGQTDTAIHEGITPWVVFEVCQSYGLSTSHFIQSMYDRSVRLVFSEETSVAEKVDRILGGIASIYDYRKLLSADPQHIVIGSETGGITGCLYLYNSMEDNTFADRYIFHRWLMERAYKRINAQDDIRAMQYWCSMYAIAMKRKGPRLTFRKGPWSLTGVLESKSRGFYHYRVDNDFPVDDIIGIVSTATDISFVGDRAEEKKTFICDMH